MTGQHVCVDCLTQSEQRRPARPRAAPFGGPRSLRCAEHQREFRAGQEVKQHERRVIRVYGLAKGEYARLLEFQGGRCAIPGCQARDAHRHLAVDHDHTTGEVRGILCSGHNYELLGKYGGDLQAALDYLKNPPARRMHTDGHMR